MRSILLALVLILIPFSISAQEQQSKNCKWKGMKGITPDLNITDFLDDSVTADWLNYDQAGLVMAQGMTIPIPRVPAEVITIFERNNRYYAKNMSGDAEIELREWTSGEPDWIFSGNPFGAPGKDENAVVDLGRIKFETGCDLNDLPLMIGVGRWSAADGYMDVTLFFVPTDENNLHVVMEGEGHTSDGDFYIRRGYSMHRLEVLPLTE